MECGIHIFVDGSFEPIFKQGGWAFVVDVNGVEFASGWGGLFDTNSNAMEVAPVLNAAIWVGNNASGEVVTIWSDSAYVVNGCNSWRHIWNSWGWRSKAPYFSGRRRMIANHREWQALHRALTENAFVTVVWCKGHSGMTGNERAHARASPDRFSVAGLPIKAIIGTEDNRLIKAGCTD